MAKIRMYALFNFKKQILVDPLGIFFQGLPKHGASVFCFPTEAAATRAAKRYVKPRFEVRALDVGSKRGKPFPVRA
jgi:hypothetical protein